MKNDQEDDDFYFILFNYGRHARAGWACIFEVDNISDQLINIRDEDDLDFRTSEKSCWAQR